MARFDFGDAFTRPWSLVFGHVGSYLATQGVFVAAAALVNLLLSLYAVASLDFVGIVRDVQATEDPRVLLDAIVPFLGVALPVGLVASLIGLVGFGVGLVVSHALLAGDRVTLGEAWARLRPRFGAFFLVSLALAGAMLAVLLVGLVVGVLTFGIGFLVAVPLGMTLLLRWCLAAPAAVIDGTGVGESFRASARYTSGSKGMLFLLFLVFTLVVGVAGAALTAPFTPTQLDTGTAEGFEEPTTGQVVGESLASLVVALASGPAFAALLVVLHRALSRPPAAPGAATAFFPAVPPPPPQP